MLFESTKNKKKKFKFLNNQIILQELLNYWEISI